MDSLLLRNIDVWTHIGVTEEERAKPQHLRVSVELFHSLTPVADSDDPSKGIDYDRVIEEVERSAKTDRKTLERFAEDLAQTLVQKFKPEGGVTVNIEKRPHPALDFASVTIHRPDEKI